MLDDLFKVAVVDITNRYDGPPAAKVAKAIFAAAKDKQYFKAKLLDATGAPQNEANVPQDEFEKRAAKAMTEGKTYLEEVVGKGKASALARGHRGSRRRQKCAKCHGVKQGRRARLPELRHSRQLIDADHNERPPRVAPTPGVVASSTLPREKRSPSHTN